MVVAWGALCSGGVRLGNEGSTKARPPPTPTPQVRDEIASCSERAYASLTLADAQRLMMFASAKEAAAYAQQVG
jgi:hypothetical protein